MNNSSHKRTPSHLSPADEIIRPKQLPSIVGFSAATARRLEIEGKFPRRRRVGLQGVGWIRSELVDYRKNQETVFVSTGGQKVGSKQAAA